MGYTEHWCLACNNSHDAALWYYQRVAPGGLAYMCGEEYNNLPAKGPWELLDPGAPPLDKMIEPVNAARRLAPRKNPARGKARRRKQSRGG
jgi:hypothetical protein